jgi:hypothetical protein
MYIEVEPVHQSIDFFFILYILAFLQQWKQLLRARGSELMFQVSVKLKFLEQVRLDQVIGGSSNVRHSTSCFWNLV